MDIPTELVVEILQRLPWTSRRRLRLVCRFWRDLIHQRTTEMQQPRDAVPLIVTTESAYIVDDLDLDLEEESSSVPRTPRELHLGGRYNENMEVVAVCNGVLCLCDNDKPGGAITLANPATGEVLALPPIPRHGLFRRHNSRHSGRSWNQAYSFGYHHGTGQYKVVHVPCFYKTKDTLQVFTLGEASWREVPAPAYARCNLDADVVSANGATYWVTEGSDDRIMSFDLDSEQVWCTQPLPVSARPISHLTQVNRRLSTTTTTHRPPHYGYGCIQVTLCKFPYMSQIQ
jgi:F-box interacting protein